MPEGVREKRTCRRCLIKDMPNEKELHIIIQERIAQMPQEEKAQAQELERRLKICQACESLNSGTCGLCGCYVELRAARAKMHCPAVPNKW